ncbi:hypothetical protein BATDEDRAFT_85881 [Batrachochytrium dendrobatidis JAM81]|uniref:Uncharacterized protein n=1 Tax=Batrachochytrium dendrobatidis (strain JAM81 / FGSC 10211) TaxID=684364 RepID=F4NS07_BATDJ|nr:uncharacterized protein BATDEDRAFT_85881 [Batrachochytrium dendrobatidis JAM81]EGF83381.1 hypothetical protein BATDEDRAFT_85881 [Batrachochytrium dendrobatidis JAM81]|eukprot:XP_006676084.1 hypothetical protein BATDEDRAFT_85881 [Batrachochytrium dendrobatidis JAM81]
MTLFKNGRSYTKYSAEDTSCKNLGPTDSTCNDTWIEQIDHPIAPNASVVDPYATGVSSKPKKNRPYQKHRQSSSKHDGNARPRLQQSSSYSDQGAQLPNNRAPPPSMLPLDNKTFTVTQSIVIDGDAMDLAENRQISRIDPALPVVSSIAIVLCTKKLAYKQSVQTLSLISKDGSSKSALKIILARNAPLPAEHSSQL